MEYYIATKLFFITSRKCDETMKKRQDEQKMTRIVSTFVKKVYGVVEKWKKCKVLFEYVNSI